MLRYANIAFYNDIIPQIGTVSSAHVTRGGRGGVRCCLTWGYEGAYGSVRRQVKAWKAERREGREVFVPLVSEPGEAFQFDWTALPRE